MEARFFIDQRRRFKLKNYSLKEVGLDGVVTRAWLSDIAHTTMDGMLECSRTLDSWGWKCTRKFKDRTGQLKSRIAIAKGG